MAALPAGELMQVGAVRQLRKDVRRGVGADPEHDALTRHQRPAKGDACSRRGGSGRAGCHDDGSGRRWRCRCGGRHRGMPGRRGCGAASACGEGDRDDRERGAERSGVASRHGRASFGDGRLTDSACLRAARTHDARRCVIRSNWRPTAVGPQPLNRSSDGKKPASTAGFLGSDRWSRHSDLNRGPAVYETAALPLSYVGAAASVARAVDSTRRDLGAAPRPAAAVVQWRNPLASALLRGFARGWASRCRSARR